LLLFTLVLAQIAAAAGYGHLFPWSIPALASGLLGCGATVLARASIILVLTTGILGLVGTIIWWRYADQN